MIWLLLVLLLLAVAVLLVLIWAVRARNMQIWLGEYFFGKRPRAAGKPIHVMFCFVDHFEPMWGGADLETEHRRVDRWCRDYRELAARHRDADGRMPQHSFFYPEEEYRKVHLDKLCAMCSEGYGEIEVHLHHDNDTADNFRSTMQGFVDLLDREHGALPHDPVSGKPVFAFIHGNWSLDNSRADGRWCGINNEISLLRDLGCYADLTLPSAPSDTQTRTINSIYYATDDPERPKSHDRGIPVRVGGKPSGDLLMVQGPLRLNWKSRRFGLIPRIEAGDVRRACPPDTERVDAWVDTGIHVAGRPDWVFVKVHTHGTQEHDMDTLLGEPAEAMFSHLESRYNDGENYQLHYVTAREVVNIIKAAEAGMEGNPNQYRNYHFQPPGWLGGSSRKDT